MGAGNRRLLVLIVIAYSALMSAWVMSSRPFAAPDESAHYLRALTISRGRLLGPRAPYPFTVLQPQLNARERAWASRDSRAVTVPASLAPPLSLCLDGRRDTHGTCVESTYTGDYAPLPYLLPAAALRLTDTASTAGWLTRAAAALPALFFLVLTLVLLWDGTATSLLGVLVAFTPMVLFTSSVLNPNGLEIASSAAFLAGLLALARAPASSPRWIWFSLALSGAVAVLSWQLGPFFVAFDVAMFLVLLGPSGIAKIVNGARRQSFMLAGSLALALALYVIYIETSGLAHATVGLGRIGDLHAGADEFTRVSHQAVGIFGALTIRLPIGIIYAWWAICALLVAAALLVASAPQRLLLLALIAFSWLFPVLLFAFVYIHTGFGMQGRYVLPVLMMVPLLAGELLARGRSVRALRWSTVLGAAVISGIAVLQLCAWWVNARASAGRPGAIWFLGHASWAPPLGWWPWLAAAAVGSILLGGAAVRAHGPQPLRADAATA
jgi:hypothetical protein